MLKIKKSHELVSARFDFTLNEMRLFTAIVSLVDDRDEDFKVYKIPLKNIIEIFDIKSQSIYSEIKQMAESLLKKVITIPLREDNVDKEIKTTMFSSFKYSKDGRGLLEVKFNNELKAFLLQLKSKYLLYEIKNILKISSANSVRFYELLKTFDGIGKRTFEVEELKRILGVEEKYTKYANFKVRVILKAQEELEKHTDIRFTFEEHTDYGKRVERITFLIHKNKKHMDVIEAGTPPDHNPEVQE